MTHVVAMLRGEILSAPGLIVVKTSGSYTHILDKQQLRQNNGKKRPKSGEHSYQQQHHPATPVLQQPFSLTCHVTLVSPTFSMNRIVTNEIVLQQN
jgi:hypothetical protein